MAHEYHTAYLRQLVVVVLKSALDLLGKNSCNDISKTSMNSQ